MASTSEFARECKEAARKMRRLPKDLRRGLAQEVQKSVAEPLAADIRAAWRGPYAPALSAATKARVQADPQIVIGGSRRVVSGGASARDLVYGTEWGGGSDTRDVLIPARGRRRRPYRRLSTQQFPRNGQHAVYGTIHRTLARTFDAWSDAVDKIIGETMRDG